MLDPTIKRQEDTDGAGCKKQPRKHDMCAVTETRLRKKTHGRLTALKKKKRIQPSARQNERDEN
jgi:hypothetical protein